MIPVEEERQRATWAAWRGMFNLVDPHSDDFGLGGVSSVPAGVRARLLITPTDPLTMDLDFTPEFWTWWRSPRSDPVTGRAMEWGHVETVTSSAAIRSPGSLDDEPARFIALHRNFSLETSLFRDAAGVSRDGRAIFRLRRIVGRVWAALAEYSDVIERFGVAGPWEVSLALIQTNGAHLSDFAAGWSDPFEGNLNACAEPGLMRIREFREWPDQPSLRDVAISFAGWIDNCWNVQQHRLFPTAHGVRGSDPDWRNYRW